MQEPHSEGVANHADLGSCAGGDDIAGEARTEALAGRLSSREIPNSGRRPCGQKGKATSFAAPTRAASEPGAVAGTRARQETLCTRTGRPRRRLWRRAGRWGKAQAASRKPCARRRGVGAGKCTDEGFEQGRATVGGESGGKAPRQGERLCTPRGPRAAAGSRVTGVGGRAASSTTEDDVGGGSGTAPELCCSTCRRPEVAQMEQFGGCPRTPGISPGGAAGGCPQGQPSRRSRYGRSGWPGGLVSRRVPERGDVFWLEFQPQRGREQQG